MRPVKAWYFAFLATILLLGGCSTNKGLIEGTKWSCRATSVKGMQIPAGLLRLEFKADGGLIYTAGPAQLTGTYSLGMGDTVILHMDKELAGSKTHAESIKVNGTVLTMTDSDGTAGTFDKVN